MKENKHSVTGSCFCGAVRFEVDLPSLFCGHCHCSMCRRSNGAAFVTWFGVEVGHFRLLDSSSLIRHRSSESRHSILLRSMRESALLRVVAPPRAHRHHSGIDAGSHRSRATGPPLLRLPGGLDRRYCSTTEIGRRRGFPEARVIAPVRRTGTPVMAALQRTRFGLRSRANFRISRAQIRALPSLEASRRPAFSTLSLAGARRRHCQCSARKAVSSSRVFQ